MHERQANLLFQAQELEASCGCKSEGGESQGDDVVWQDPSSYQASKHGPSYLPRIASADRRRIQAAANEVRPQAVDLLNKVARVVKAGVANPPIEMVELNEGSDAAQQAQGYKPLADLLAIYRGVGMVHQTHHWQTRGGHYYADHLLFQRLYDETNDGLVDAIAERTSGLGHWILVDLPSQIRAVSEVVSMLSEGGYTTPQAMMSVSNQAVLLARSAVAVVIERLKSEGLMTAGLDDLLPAQAGVFESHSYLLGQRMRSF